MLELDLLLLLKAFVDALGTIFAVFFFFKLKI